MTIRGARAAVAVVALALVWVTPAGATSTDRPLAPSADERTDLLAIAQSEGVSLEEAVDRFAWQDKFAIAATAVEEAYPEAFSGAEITSETPAVATIRFAGAVPAGVGDVLAELPSSVRVELVPGEAMTAAEIDGAVIEAHRAVSATGKVRNSASWYDSAAGVVRVAAQPREAGHRSRAALTVEARLIRESLPLSAGPVDLVLDPGAGGADEARNGGGRLENSGSSGLACTAGFNVINSAGTTGVATAGHCGNSLSHENTNGAAEYALTYRSQHLGQWGDFQWHTSTDTEPDDFYYNASSIRDVSARANPVDSQTICRFGHNTGAQCSRVEDLSTCVTVDGVEACRLVRMENDEAGGGDSGGPWYYGNTAYGFHKGQTSCGFLWLSTCDVWSRVTYIDDALGVTVRTS